MADRFEKSMPDFWKRVGTKSFEITGAITLTLFIALNSEINGLRSQVSDLNRYHQELVPHDESQRRDEERNQDWQSLKQDTEKQRKAWIDDFESMQKEIEEIEEADERSLRALTKQIGDLRVRLAVLENQPQPNAEPDKKSPPKKPGERARP